MNRTMQREAILKELRGRSDHPTAEQIYSSLKPGMPKLSLGTVYRDLAQLSRKGTILQLNNSAGQRRFDGCTARHSHMRCTICGGVTDVESPLLTELHRGLEQAAEEFGCGGFTLEFSGICGSCMIKNSKSPAEKPSESIESGDGV